MPSCDPSDLLEASKCFHCIPNGMEGSVVTLLLCEWANAIGCVTPSAPTALDAQNITDAHFDAFWSFVVGDGYKLEVSTDINFGSFILGYGPQTIFDSGSTDIFVVGLSPNTTYYYRVRAFNSCGDGPNSNTIQVTTLP